MNYERPRPKNTKSRTRKPLEYFPLWRNHLWVVQILFHLFALIPADYGGTYWVKYVWAVFSSIFLVLVTANILELIYVVYYTSARPLSQHWRLFPDYLIPYLAHNSRTTASPTPVVASDVPEAVRLARRFDWSLAIHLIDLYFAIDIAYLGIFQTFFLFDSTAYFVGFETFAGSGRTIYGVWAKLYYMTVLLNSGTGFGLYLPRNVEVEVFGLCANYTNKIYFLFVFGYLVSQVASVAQKSKLTRKSNVPSKIL